MIEYLNKHKQIYRWVYVLTLYTINVEQWTQKVIGMYKLSYIHNLMLSLRNHNTIFYTYLMITIRRNTSACIIILIHIFKTLLIWME